MRDIIEQYCNSCMDCQTGKTPRLPKAGLMVPMEAVGPWERVGLDFLGAFPKTDRGNKWILVMTDHFTKWAEARAFPACTQEEVVTFFIENIICRFGVPAVILTDRGTNF